VATTIDALTLIGEQKCPVITGRAFLSLDIIIQFKEIENVNPND
jgi:hypothetical protein